MAASIDSEEYLRMTVDIHGRDYQRYSIDSSVYPIPIDEEEEDRLEEQHSIFYLLFGHRLFLPPLSYPMRVLDCGYGQGQWAVNMAQMYTESEIIGVDIWHPDLAEVPDNLDLSFWNLNERLTRHGDLRPNSFDLVHSRCVCPGITRTRWSSYIEDLARLLKRGGWVQMAEYYYNIQSDNGRLTEQHSMHQWGVTYRGLIQSDRDPRIGQTLAQKLRDAGLRDVQSTTFRIPIGDWPAVIQADDGRYDTTQRDIGIRNVSNIDKLLDSHALWPFTHRGFHVGNQVQRYTPQQVRWLTDAARLEARDPSLRLYIPLYVAWGRKR